MNDKKIKMEEFLEKAHTNFIDYACSNGTKDDSEYRTLYSLDFINDMLKENDPNWIEENELPLIRAFKAQFELELLIRMNKRLPHKQVYDKSKRVMLDMMDDEEAEQTLIPSIF